MSEANLNKFNLVFQPRLNFLEIVLRRIKEIFAWLVFAGLIVVGLYGILGLGFYFFIFGPEQARSFLNTFYFSVVADMFLIYLLKRRKEKTPQIGLSPAQAQTEVSQFLDKPALESLEKAWLFCYRKGYHHLRPIHLFHSFVRQKSFREISKRLNCYPEQILQKTKNILKSSSFFPESKKGINIFGPEMASDFKNIFIEAYLTCLKEKRRQIGVLDLLLAMSQKEELVNMVFDEFGISPEEIKRVALWGIIEKQSEKQEQSFFWRRLFKPKGKLDRAMTASLTPFLDRMSRDLTFLARQKTFEMVLGREKEIEDIFNFFAAGQHAILLVGESKIGKKAILKKIAQLMVEEDVPEFLRDKRLVQLDLASLVGLPDIRERGEEYFKKALYEVNRAGNIILVIENLHNLLGLKAQESGLDFSEILSLALNNKGFYFIGTTSLQDYPKIEGTALGRILNKIDIPLPSPNLIWLILISKILALETRLKILFSVDALEEAINLAGRYLYGKALTAKAMDLLIEAGYRKAKTGGRDNLVQAEDIAKLVAEKTRIPLGQIEETEKEKLLNLEQLIHQRLVNQKEAVEAVASALRRSRLRVKNRQRPIANFLFVGPTGVGKTELAKSLARVYFGDEKRMIRLDMSEYQEKRNLSRLIGFRSERGVEKGYLTEKVKRQPYSLLLLDELEKAHKDILNIFLQIMDDGRLTDVSNETINFANVILIATSNAGTAFIQNKVKQKAAYEEIFKELKQKILLEYFSPEFLNRFDSIILFRPLTLEHLVAITYIFLKEIKDRLEEKGIIFEAEQEAAEELAMAGYDPLYGARGLRRTVQEKVETPLSQLLLEAGLKRRDRIVLRKGLVFDIEEAVRF